MPAGQPTKYNATMQKRADVYLTTFNSGHGHLLPTIEGLSKALKVSRQTLYGWGDVHSKFFDTLEQLRSEQKRMVLESGLSGEYNSTIAKLILSANHGMHEKQERGLTGADGGAIVIQEIKRTIVD